MRWPRALRPLEDAGVVGRLGANLQPVEEAQPRRRHRGTGIQAVIDQMPQHLHLALRLHEAADAADAAVKCAVAPEHPGDDRVVGRLPGASRLG